VAAISRLEQYHSPKDTSWIWPIFCNFERWSCALAQIPTQERLTLMSSSMKNLFLAVFALLATGVYAQSQPACCQKSGSAAPSCSSSAAKTDASCHDKSAPADKAKGGKTKKSAAKSSKKGEVAVIERRMERLAI
jgi:hypothetical protein